MSNSIYPFTAIVGQARLKQALILNAINPAIGGVPIRGEKGNLLDDHIVDVILDAQYFQIEDLKADTLINIAKESAQ